MNDQDRAAYQAALDRLQDADGAHHLHPFTDPKTLAANPPFVIDSAEGAYVTALGIKLFDAMSGLGCVNIGYGHPEMAEAAKKAITDINYYHAFAATTTPPPAKLAQMLAERTPEGFNKAFFANSGSEANETILKLIRMYWHVQKKPEKRKLISRKLAYHGSTMATTGLNGRPEMWAPFDLDVSDIIHVEAPFWYRNGGDLSPAEYGHKAAKAVEDAILAEGADTVAAIFCEPIQGTGGAIIPPETYLPELSRIAKEQDVLLVADEVLTGMGRTGTWTASDDMGLDGDFMSVAKGLSSAYAPISAAMVHDRVFDVLEPHMGVFQHGFTTGAHPVAAQLAVTNLSIITRENLVEKIHTDIGPYFAKRMDVLKDHPMVGEVRTKGLICGIEICKDQRTREQFPIDFHIDEHIGQALLFKGVIVRPVGNTIVLCPPFIMTRVEADYVAKSCLEAIDDIYSKVKAEGLV